MMSAPTKIDTKDNFLLWLYDQYSDYVYNLAWQLSPSSQDVDDLVQTVWEKLITKEHILRTLDRPQQLNYISKTLKNTIREDFRNKKLLTCSLDNVTAFHDGCIERINESIDRAIQGQLFQHAWSQVDEDIRELLERKYDLQQTDEEIARSMGIKSTSVRMYLTRAKKAARKVLNSYKSQFLL